MCPQIGAPGRLLPNHLRWRRGEGCSGHCGHGAGLGLPRPAPSISLLLVLGRAAPLRSGRFLARGALRRGLRWRTLSGGGLPLPGLLRGLALLPLWGSRLPASTALRGESPGFRLGEDGPADGWCEPHDAVVLFHIEQRFPAPRPGATRGVAEADRTGSGPRPVGDGPGFGQAGAGGGEVGLLFRSPREPTFPMAALPREVLQRGTFF